MSYVQDFGRKHFRQNGRLGLGSPQGSRVTDRALVKNAFSAMKASVT